MNKGFVLHIKKHHKSSLLYHRPLALRDLLGILSEYLYKRFIILYKGEFYGIRDHRQTLQEILKTNRVSYKSIRQRWVVLSFREFQTMERRLRRAMSGGDIEWFDCDSEPTSAILSGLRLRELKFSYTKELVMSSELGTTISYHAHDNEFAGMYVQNKKLERQIIEGLITLIAKREYKRLLKKEKSPYSPDFTDMTQKVFGSLRSIISKEGITCLRRDIRVEGNELMMTCWYGFPERVSQYNKSFDICYSFNRNEWRITKTRSMPFPYNSAKLLP